MSNHKREEDLDEKQNQANDAGGKSLNDSEPAETERPVEDGEELAPDCIIEDPEPDMNELAGDVFVDPD